MDGTGKANRELAEMNYCLALLRILVCYAVISIHFGTTLPFSGLAVPIFMLMAFYFQKDDHTCLYLKKRLGRIAVPFLVWSLAGFLARSFVDGKIEWQMLGYQLLFGMPANSPLYFMNLLMINTLIVWAIERWFEKIWLWLYVFIVLACIAFECSSLNGSVWTWLPKVGEITCGRFVELLPFAVIGRMLHSLDRDGNIVSMIICGIVSCMIFGLLQVVGICPNGCYYNYGGLYFIFIATGMFAIVAGVGNALSSEGVARFQHLLRRAAEFSGLMSGVYFSHKIVGGGGSDAAI